MSANVELPSNLKALTKLQLIKLVGDLSQVRSPMKTPKATKGSNVSLKRLASQAHIDGVPNKKPRTQKTTTSGPLQQQALARRLKKENKRARQLRWDSERKARWEKQQREKAQERQVASAKQRAAPPKAAIRAMSMSRKGASWKGNLKVTVPVFGDTNDDGTLKKEISLVDGSRYTNPGELLLKIWTFPEQPVPRKVLVTEKGFKGDVVRCGRLVKYLLRLKKTELVTESKDGFRLSNTFKPWMLTGVQPTSTKFKPSVQGLFKEQRYDSTRNHFREVHLQAGGSLKS